MAQVVPLRKHVLHHTSGGCRAASTQHVYEGASLLRSCMKVWPVDAAGSTRQLHIALVSNSPFQQQVSHFVSDGLYGSCPKGEPQIGDTEAGLCDSHHRARQFMRIVNANREHTPEELHAVIQQNVLNQLI